MTASADEGLKAGAVCLVLSPVLLLLSALVHPVGRSDYGEQLEVIAGGLNRWYFGHLIFLVGLGLLIPAVLTLKRLARERAGSLGTAGSILAVVGILAFTGFIAIDGFVFWAMADPDLDRAAMVALYEQLEEGAGIFLPFPFTSMALNLGLLLLAVALYRSRAVPTWMPVLLAISAVVRAVGRPSGMWAAITAAEVLSTVALGGIGLALMAGTSASRRGRPA